MESLEIAHKLLQLITRTLIQMITLKQRVGLCSLFTFRPFHFFSCTCFLVRASFCVCVWLKGQRSGAPWRTDRAKATSLTLPPILPPSPCAVTGCLCGWRFPWQQKPREEAAVCERRLMRNGALKVQGRGHNVILGGAGAPTTRQR